VKWEMKFNYTVNGGMCFLIPLQRVCSETSSLFWRTNLFCEKWGRDWCLECRLGRHVYSKRVAMLWWVLKMSRMWYWGTELGIWHWQWYTIIFSEIWNISHVAAMWMVYPRRTSVECVFNNNWVKVARIPAEVQIDEKWMYSYFGNVS